MSTFGAKFLLIKIIKIVLAKVSCIWSEKRQFQNDEFSFSKFVVLFISFTRNSKILKKQLFPKWWCFFGPKKIRPNNGFW
jgi:hypothetical protein